MGLSLKTWLKGAVAATATAGLLLSCRAGVSVADRPLSAVGHAGATGSVNLRVELPAQYLPELKIAEATRRRVQYVDWTTATSARFSYMGAGIDGWHAGASAAFTSGATRVATFSGVALPSGLRRIIRVDLHDKNNRAIHTLWGVGDVGGPSDPPVNITVTPYTTPAAEIFRDLIAVGDKEKALAVPVAEVQRFVDNMLDFDSQAQVASTATGFDGNLDGAVAPVAPALLDTHPLTMAIIRGAADPSGVRVPYAVPSPPFAPSHPDLVPTPLRQATVTIKALDTDGQPVTSACVVYVSDPVSPVQLTTSPNTVNQTFFPVAVGNWSAGVVDTVRGRRITADMRPTLWSGQHRELVLAMPMESAQRTLGTYNLSMRRGHGFNGDAIHKSFAYLNDPGHMAIKAINGKRMLYFLDNKNHRVRCVNLDDDDASVLTVAGGKVNGTLRLLSSNDLFVEDAPAGQERYALFSETTSMGLRRIARVKLNAEGTSAGTPVETLVDFSALPASVWSSSHRPGALHYDQAAGLLYVGSVNGGSFCRIRLQDAGTGEPVYPAAGSSAPLITDPAAPSYGGGGFVKSGNMLFYSGRKLMNTTSGVVTIYPLMRRDVTRAETAAGAVTILASDPAYFHSEQINNTLETLDQEPYYDFLETIDYRYTVDARRYFQRSPHEHMRLDPHGNLYFGARDPAAPAKDHTSQDSFFRVTNALGDGGASAPWYVSYFDVRAMLGLPHVGTDAETLRKVLTGIAIDPVAQPNGRHDIYCAGHARMPNPNGSGEVLVDAIYRLRP